VGGFGGWGGGPVFGVVVLVVAVGGVESLADAGDLVVAAAVGFEAGPFEVERFVGVAQLQSGGDGGFGLAVAAGLPVGGGGVGGGVLELDDGTFGGFGGPGQRQPFERLATHQRQGLVEQVGASLTVEGAGTFEQFEGLVEVGGDMFGEPDEVGAAAPSG
jgi:hypothetical protein